jgi:hypothetical protein
VGLFDFLFASTKSRVKLLEDHIWISQAAKFGGIERELLHRAASNPAPVLLIAHFPETLTRLDAIATQHRQVTAILARMLAPYIVRRLLLDASATINLIVAERHPLYSVDQKIIQFGEQLPCRCRVTFHLSMEDPLFKRFNDVKPRIEGILKMLGIKDNELFEHKMISRSITHMQKKCEAKALGDQQANSAAEWIEKNLPQ